MDFYAVLSFTQDYHYLDSGNSDGSFRRNRFFKCKKNCGLYIPLDKLASKPSSPQTTGVSCSNYGSSDSADSKRMGAFFIVKVLTLMHTHHCVIKDIIKCGQFIIATSYSSTGESEGSL